MAFLGAHPVWLDFPDHQYLAKDDRPGLAEVAPVLEHALVEASPTAVFLPMGLANPDHDLTHDAGLAARTALLAAGDSPAWFCYEDHGYKHIPGLLAWRVSKLFHSGVWPTPTAPAVDPGQERKQAAIAHYTSQLLALEADWQIGAKLRAPAPEQVWRLAPPPEGWELLSTI